ncbi:uncharacterized protein LOC112087985 [Eutrema salsugineum]|uniref:uncharacterized protein LOC112087985 n=1 Tax=Eutrema salsugineum TaxID=72664 RepID=UPI000CED07B5|nr:uncharacterized protein LOC112087985 [Eutrema salsugineum]
MEEDDLPRRIITAGDQPWGQRVITYQKFSIIQDLISALDEGEIDFIRQSPLGKITGYTLNAGLVRNIWVVPVVPSVRVKRKNEIWIFFAGHPIRFSLREFKIVTDLNCGRFPVDLSKKRKSANYPMYDRLFDKKEDVTVERVIAILKAKRNLSKENRLRMACLVLVDGILVPTVHYPRVRVVKEHAEMTEDLETFMEYPWGRLSFDMMITSIKGLDLRKLAKANVAVQGLFAALQLVVSEAVPAIGDCLNPVGGGEVDSDDDFIPHQRHHLQLKLSHAREVDEALTCIIRPEVEFDSDEEDLSWADDPADPKIDKILKLIAEGFKFTSEMFTGGKKPSEIAVKVKKRRGVGGRSVGGRSVVGKNLKGKEKRSVASTSTTEEDRFAILKENNKALLADLQDWFLDNTVVEERYTSQTVSDDSASAGENDGNRARRRGPVNGANKDGETQTENHVNIDCHSQAAALNGVHRDNVNRVNTMIAETPIPRNPTSPSAGEDNSTADDGNPDDTNAFGIEANVHEDEDGDGANTDIQDGDRSTDDISQPMVVGGNTTRVQEVIKEQLVGDIAEDNVCKGGDKTQTPCVEEGKKGVKSKINAANINGGASDGSNVLTPPEGVSHTDNETIISEGTATSLALVVYQGIGETENIKEVDADADETTAVKKGLNQVGGCFSVLGESIPDYTRKSKRPHVVSSRIDDRFQCDKRLKTLIGHETEAGVAKARKLDEKVRLAIGTVMDGLIRFSRHMLRVDMEDGVGLRVELLDTKFVSQLTKLYPRFIKSPAREEFPFTKSVIDMVNGVDDVDRVQLYEEADIVYLPFNFDQRHWVTLAVDLKAKKIFVLDCNVALINETRLVDELQPIASMLPYLFKLVAANMEMSQVEISPFSIERVTGIHQIDSPHDSGMYSIFLLQTHAVGGIDG